MTIVMTSLVNLRRVSNFGFSDSDVYIGRPSKWGNPFSHQANTLAQFRVKSREEAIIAYGDWILDQEDLLDALCELKGKRLGCWCLPLSCHGEILIDLVEALT